MYIRFRWYKQRIYRYKSPLHDWIWTMRRKTQDNQSINQSINQWFNVKYGIWFTSETEMLIFIKILSHKWHKFHIQRQEHWIFCLLHCLWFFTCFFPIFDTACNIWRDSTIAFYFHTVELTLCLLLFAHCEKRQWRYYFYSMDKTRYFMYENVMIIDVSWVPLQYIL